MCSYVYGSNDGLDDDDDVLAAMVGETSVSKKKNARDGANWNGIGFALAGMDVGCEGGRRGAGAELDEGMEEGVGGGVSGGVGGGVWKCMEVYGGL